MNSKWLTIKQLDQQLGEWRALNSQFPMPKAGWIKTLRTALNMPVMYLANKLGVKRGRIAQLEKAEANGNITLRALKEAAIAMNCEFVYAIMPKNFTSLEEIINAKAKLIATERVKNIAQTMALEDQSLNNDYLKLQRDELAKNLREDINKNIWNKDKMIESLEKLWQENPEIYDFINKKNNKDEK